MRLLIILAALLLPIQAAALERITDRDQFVAAVEGREIFLRYLLVPISLRVASNGAISGQAGPSGVTGSWTWDGGYFCRSMTWGSRDIPYNCQEVMADASNIRFTSDRGAGDTALFQLR
ncbi:MAG: dihydrodipicolinate reductase [Shimia sp.]